MLFQDNRGTGLADAASGTLIVLFSCINLIVSYLDSILSADFLKTTVFFCM